MPSLISILMIGAAGICLYIGLSYLVAVRSIRQHRQPLLFGLLCMIAGIYFFLTLYGYKSFAREALIFATHWEESLSLIMVLIILWFVADYSNWKPKIFLTGLTVFIGILVLISLFLPFSVTWEYIDAVVTRSTPWNERINVLTGKVSPWGYASYAAYAAIIGFGIATIRRLWRWKDYTHANYLLFPLILAVICFFNDILLSSDLINSFYLIPYVYIAIILSIGNYLETNRLRALENYHTLFDAVNDAVTVHDAFSGKLLDANRAAMRMFGATREELLYGTISRTLLMPAIVSDHTKAHILVDHQEEPHLIERLFRRYSDGREFWMETALRAEVIDGNPVILAVTRNIDARKKIEEEMEKTQRLESLGILAGGIAHDFNNLLGGIYGYMSCARQKSEDKEINECLDATLGTLDRARSLTQQLLTFSKGGTPRLKTAFIHDTIRETVQFALSGSAVSFSVNLPDDLWPCMFDRNQLAQVIENIVINAHQAMPGGEGRITVSAENSTISEGAYGSLKAGRYVKISIEDNGSGIPKDNTGKIFDPFYSTKENGCGLGLATAFSIMKRHEGAIGFDTVPGSGSTFFLYVPASAEPVPEKTPPPYRPEKMTGTILIMDDEESVRNAVGLMLKSRGFTVLTANDGKEVLERFDRCKNSQSPVTAMILDLTVPGKMGGKETVAAIRQRDSGIPVFVYSGYAEDPIIAHPTDYGFTDSIRKPFTSEELMEMISKHLK